MSGAGGGDFLDLGVLGPKNHQNQVVFKSKPFRPPTTPWSWFPPTRRRIREKGSAKFKFSTKHVGGSTENHDFLEFFLCFLGHFLGHLLAPFEATEGHFLPLFFTFLGVFARFGKKIWCQRRRKFFGSGVCLTKEKRISGGNFLEKKIKALG